MPYQLLTGATGLLGYYLLKDAAGFNMPLAVVARASRTASARQRIEDMLTRWEQKTTSLLPRPVVFDGDLTKPDLGLSASQVDWVRNNCQSVIHNAASLSFVADDSGEPYSSNVDGTQNVLDLCNKTGIRTFHHVSTAYVCGMREGTILESERDIGQTLGNDYEKSKIRAEEMVASADFLDSKTFFRPGIIIGDSRSGYTSTFHGFYVPLKVTHGLIQGLKDYSGITTTELMQLFNLDGTETKNLVPVDWVSAVMMRVIATPAYHGRTYHLTPTERTYLADMVEVISEVNNSSLKSERQDTVSPELFRSTLFDQMQVYEAYWRDDPVFDRSNTLDVAKDLPCPRVDKDLLRRMCLFAIKSNFGWPVEPSQIPAIQMSEFATANHNSTHSQQQNTVVIGLRITGPGGGDWELHVCNGTVTHVTEGLTTKSDTVARIASHTLQDIQGSMFSANAALQVGRIILEPSDAISIPDTCKLINQFVCYGANKNSPSPKQDQHLILTDKGSIG